MPVAEATVGGTPIDRSKGWKMMLPPRPRAPAMRPPQKEKTTSFVQLPSRTTSQLPSLPPFAFIFKLCSYKRVLVACIVIATQTAIKTISIVQPPQEHLSIPMMLGMVFDPLSKLTKASNKKIEKLIPYLFGCQCVFSFSTIQSNSCYSASERALGFSSFSALFSSSLTTQIDTFSYVLVSAPASFYDSSAFISYSYANYACWASFAFFSVSQFQIVRDFLPVLKVRNMSKTAKMIFKSILGNIIFIKTPH